MASVGWQSIVRRACGDTLDILRRHWVIEFIAAAVLLLGTVGALGMTGNWQEAVVTVIAEAGAALAIILVIFVYYAVKAPKKIRDTAAAKEFSRTIEQSEQDVLFMYLRDALSDDTMGIADACVFGSAAFFYPPPRDIDLAVRFKDLLDKDVIRANARLDNPVIDFKERFNYPLHVQRFLYSECSLIERFNLRAEPRRNVLGILWE